MTDTMTPQYEHDCTICTFLGRHGRFDLYACKQGRVEVIVRQSAEGPDYYSVSEWGFDDLKPVSPAYEAMIEAVARVRKTVVCEADVFGLDEHEAEQPLATFWVRAEQVSCGCYADMAVCADCLKTIMERFTCTGCGN